MTTLEQLLRTIIIDKAPNCWWGNGIFQLLAEPYIAGHSLEDGVTQAQKEYRDFGRYSTLDILGEAARTTVQAEEHVKAYSSLITTIGLRRMSHYVSVSLKPSAICAVDEDGHTHRESEETLVERLTQIVALAETKGVRVTLDMEDQYWTTATLKYAKELWKTGRKNFGIVLQSRLDRTQDDIQDLFVLEHYEIPRTAQRIRACIGIYQVPEDLGTNDRQKAKEQLIERVKELFAAGVYLEIATHDLDVVKRIREEIIKPQNIPNTRYEFQFLRGVQNAYDVEKALMDNGAIVRYYMPVELTEGDSIPYMQRRLRANPDIFWHGIRNFLQTYVPFGRTLASYLKK